jgi:hypothetical protein
MGRCVACGGSVWGGRGTMNFAQANDLLLMCVLCAYRWPQPSSAWTQTAMGV